MVQVTEKETYPVLVAGKVTEKDGEVVRKVLERARWTESQFVRQLIQLDTDTIEKLREAREQAEAA